MASTFSKGDVVVLRSGGPAMTVVGPLSEQGMVGARYRMGGATETDLLCTWFDKGEQKYGTFDPELLKKSQ
jgi:uncharacterized protein YodC (DUF2158 family)